eukprot:TRINITY_DN7435_c0_g1_i25.p1 TRINITY_DN7435_c0_g1~~TRINITY_DN7435_c0_g1_i25.p1  ORF type:complete len:397 (+),score=80.10 TRINITY_DN7435_c0_g1_i25:914-2104(+)
MNPLSNRSSRISFPFLFRLGPNMLIPQVVGDHARDSTLIRAQRFEMNQHSQIRLQVLKKISVFFVNRCPGMILYTFTGPGLGQGIISEINYESIIDLTICYRSDYFTNLEGLSDSNSECASQGISENSVLFLRKQFADALEEVFGVPIEVCKGVAGAVSWPDFQYFETFVCSAQFEGMTFGLRFVPDSRVSRARTELLTDNDFRFHEEIQFFFSFTLSSLPLYGHGPFQIFCNEISLYPSQLRKHIISQINFPTQRQAKILHYTHSYEDFLLKTVIPIRKGIMQILFSMNDLYIPHPAEFQHIFSIQFPHMKKLPNSVPPASWFNKSWLANLQTFATNPDSYLTFLFGLLREVSTWVSMEIPHLHVMVVGNVLTEGLCGGVGLGSDTRRLQEVVGM